jgi:hypothetical protein
MDFLKADGLALQFASDRLKGIKNVVLEAVKDNGLALQFASDNLKNNLQLYMLYYIIIIMYYNLYQMKM